MSEPHDRLRQARVAAGFASAREAARAHRWSEDTYKSHESGIRGIRREMAERYAKAFKVDLGWLLLGRGPGPKGAVSVPEVAPVGQQPLQVAAPPFQPIIDDPREPGGRHLPVYGSAAGGDGGELIDYDAVVAWMPAPRSLVGVNKAFGMYVVGDSCAPRFNQGDIVWTHPGRPPSRGCGVVIVFNDNTALVKIFVRRDDGELEVEQLNPPETLRFPRARVSGVFRIVTTDHP